MVARRRGPWSAPAVAANDSSMTLRFYGAGAAFSRRYGTTCSGLTLRSGDQWLIDCGRQAPDQLHAAGVSWHAIAGQIMTHVHGDHTFGLEDFAFSRYYHADAAHQVASILDGGPRPKLVCHSAVRDEVWETMRAAFRYVGTKGGGNSSAATLETYFEIVGAVETLPPDLEAWPAGERFDVDGLKLWTRDTIHVPEKPSTSLEVAVDDDRVMWWSGDSTVHTDVLTDLQDRATIIFHDCTFIEYEGQVHGSFDALAALPEALRTKIVLMHHEDDLEDHRERAEKAGFRIALPGHVYDLESGQRRA
ncbi:MAG: hypothetical protein AAF721_16650 [Myxococcota bacterium]